MSEILANNPPSPQQNRSDHTFAEKKKSDTLSPAVSPPRKVSPVSKKLTPKHVTTSETDINTSRTSQHNSPLRSLKPGQTQPQRSSPANNNNNSNDSAIFAAATGNGMIATDRHNSGRHNHNHQQQQQNNQRSPQDRRAAGHGIMMHHHDAGAHHQGLLLSPTARERSPIPSSVASSPEKISQHEGSNRQRQKSSDPKMKIVGSSGCQGSEMETTTAAAVAGPRGHRASIASLGWLPQHTPQSFPQSPVDQDDAAQRLALVLRSSPQIGKAFTAGSSSPGKPDRSKDSSAIDPLRIPDTMYEAIYRQSALAVSSSADSRRRQSSWDGEASKKLKSASSTAASHVKPAVEEASNKRKRASDDDETTGLGIITDLVGSKKNKERKVDDEDWSGWTLDIDTVPVRNATEGGARKSEVEAAVKGGIATLVEEGEDDPMVGVVERTEKRDELGFGNHSASNHGTSNSTPDMTFAPHPVGPKHTIEFDDLDVLTLRRYHDHYHIPRPTVRCHSTFPTAHNLLATLADRHFKNLPDRTFEESEEASERRVREAFSTCVRRARTTEGGEGSSQTDRLFRKRHFEYDPPVVASSGDAKVGKRESGVASSDKKRVKGAEKVKAPQTSEDLSVVDVSTGKKKQQRRTRPSSLNGSIGDKDGNPQVGKPSPSSTTTTSRGKTASPKNPPAAARRKSMQYVPAKSSQLAQTSPRVARGKGSVSPTKRKTTSASSSTTTAPIPAAPLASVTTSNHRPVPASAAVIRRTSTFGGGGTTTKARHAKSASTDLDVSTKARSTASLLPSADENGDRRRGDRSSPISPSSSPLSSSSSSSSSAASISSAEARTPLPTIVPEPGSRRAAKKPSAAKSRRRKPPPPPPPPPVALSSPGKEPSSPPPVVERTIYHPPQPNRGIKVPAASSLAKLDTTAATIRRTDGPVSAISSASLLSSPSTVVEDSGVVDSNQLEPARTPIIDDDEPMPSALDDHPPPPSPPPAAPSQPIVQYVPGPAHGVSVRNVADASSK